MLYIPTPGCEDSLSIRAGWGVGEHYGGSSKVFPQAARWGTGRGLTSASSRRICRTFPVALHGSSFTRLQMGKRSQLLQLNFQRYSLLQQILEKKRRKKKHKTVMVSKSIGHGDQLALYCQQCDAIIWWTRVEDPFPSFGVRKSNLSRHFLWSFLFGGQKFWDSSFQKRWGNASSLLRKRLINR